MGAKSVTFGGGAAAHVTPGHHMSGTKMKMLGATYDAIVKQFNLGRKSEFREKMGTLLHLLMLVGDNNADGPTRCHTRPAIHRLACSRLR